MARQIKFRAWDGEQMFYNVQDAYKGHTGKPHPIEAAWAVSFGELLAIGGRFRVMQLTDLKDKNGKEIYEGDIVKRETYHFGVDGGAKENWIVEIGWCSRRKRISDNNNVVAFDPIDARSNCIVIGNIHENPELLRAENFNEKSDNRQTQIENDNQHVS